MLFDESLITSRRPGHVEIDYLASLTRGRSTIDWYSDNNMNADVVMALKLDDTME